MSKTDKTRPLKIRLAEAGDPDLFHFPWNNDERGVSPQAARAAKRQHSKANRRSKTPLKAMHGRGWFGAGNYRMIPW